MRDGSASVWKSIWIILFSEPEDADIARQNPDTNIVLL
jgi:hypothetical protein